MTALLFGLLVAQAIGGLSLIIAGLLPRQPRVPSSRWDVNRWWNQLSTKRRWTLGLTGLATLVALAVTRWLPVAIILPLASLLGPKLLSDPPNRDVAVLEALDRWVRSLIASLLTGKSVPDAIRSTRRQAPEAIAEAIWLTAARLDEHWPLPEAMAGFADEVDHADADAVSAALIVSGQRGTTAAMTLEALADALQDRLSAAREIENERAKPRIVVRQVTAITVVVFGLALVTSPAYFEPYRHGLGPLIACALALVYIGALAKLQAASRPTPRTRMGLVTDQSRRPS